ncbi:MAG: hypothetical protein WC456_04035 [Patescibacteria group bacterium]
MKTILMLIMVLVFFLTAPLITTLTAQDSIPESDSIEDSPLSAFIAKTNVIGFGGYWFLPSNINNNGSWDGAYFDYRFYESQYLPILTVGLYGTANWTRFTDNLSRYSAQTREFSGGLVIGYYTEQFSQTRPMFLGLSLGIKHGKDNGESSSRYGKYSGTQIDFLWSLGLNLNLIKVPEPGEKMWPRTQILLNLESPFSSKKEAFWNSEKIESAVWNRSYLGITAKQSIMDHYYNVGLVISPKIIATYSYSWGDSQNNYGLGGEISLHQPFKDDFLSIYYIFKISNKLGRNVSNFGININFALILLYNN